MGLRVVIVGGGFSGAAAAVQPVRRSARALAATIAERRAKFRRGPAYATTARDHRPLPPTTDH